MFVATYTIALCSFYIGRKRIFVDKIIFLNNIYVCGIVSSHLDYFWEQNLYF